MQKYFNFSNELFDLADQNSLYFRRQFLLSSENLKILSSWKSTTIGQTFYLKTHPDLGLTQIEKNAKQITLLGYLFDSDNPDKSQTKILSDLALSDHDHQSVLKATNAFAGRWILIYHTKSSLILFTDPSGLRSVYYSDSPELPFVCASEPGIIARLLNLNYSQASSKLFLNSSYIKSDREHWAPSGISLYREIKHLVPNHYLDLKTKETKRFWPWEEIKTRDIHDVASESSVILKNLLECGAKHFDLALPITAGVDSRALLAASKDIKEKIFYYTLMYYDLKESDADIKIPANMLRNLGLEHYVLNCSGKMSPDFRKIYFSSVDKAHEAWGHIAYGLSKNYPADKVCIKGNCSEIARCFYYKGGYPRKITATTLAQLNGMEKNQFCIPHFEKWLQNSYQTALDSNIHILDLFYWEHRMGSWQAMSQLEWDIVQESYTPFNCRKLLHTLLSSKMRYREPAHYELFRLIIHNLWPDLLNEPINPKPFKIIKNRVQKLLRITGTYPLIKQIKKLSASM
ncbi:MAG: hypothetical protein GY874_02620 [Desulfobacteraceae bacterium]|nr:hypothetical protein [Desulfobacteraceae bacterium]